ncbi:MAG: ATP-dependent helicase HrpB [Lentisphaerae bacterium GWF2_52_8]|nr:MAG: ATP-dependent helicase HrpB [Lentisphaerae bacterium GWF2_52_8]
MNPSLPVEKILPELRLALRQGSGAVLQAAPGAGKTTRVPLALLGEEWLAGKRILMLEPRRLATKAAARMMSRLLGEQPGGTVGYRVRMESVVSRRTRIEIVTEGILTRMIQDDPSLEGVGLIIFDEFHERSIHADLGLALSLDSRQILREDLKILVMSATLDANPLVQLLGDAPLIKAEGRSFPVETRHFQAAAPGQIPRAMSAAILRALREESGSILAFLPGTGAIRQTETLLSENGLGEGVIIAPLYGDLPGAEQDRALLPPPEGARKVVLATSIAESSLTIEGVRVVIDSGLTRIPSFDPASGLSRLETVRISQASAEQRKGRAGRLEPGICWRLWDEHMHRGLPAFRRPEILDADLASLALELAQWGASEPSALRWLDPPPDAAFRQARKLLLGLEAVDAKGKISAHGRKMLVMGLHPRLGHMLAKGTESGHGQLASEIAALLSDRDIFRGGTANSCSDLRLRIEAMRGQRTVGFNCDSGALQQAKKLSSELYSRCGKPSRANCGEKDTNAAGLLLSFAYPDRVAQRRGGMERRYLLANGRGGFLQEGDPLTRDGLIVAASLDAGEREARIFLAAPITEEELLKHHSAQIEKVESVEWDRREKAVSARREILFGKLVLGGGMVSDANPEKVRECLLSGLREEGLNVLPWDDELRSWLGRVNFLHRVDRSAEWPDLSESWLLEHLEEWLGPYLKGISRISHLHKIELKSILKNLLPHGMARRLDDLAPSTISVPTGSRIRLDYTSGDTPLLSVRLQEMFGLKDTPRLAGGKIPVMIDLLSPAQRPVQRTQDLASFWANTYERVRKDLRGRYPRHSWPEDPLNAPPTRRAKAR